MEEEETVIKIDWNFETDYLNMVGNPEVLQYNNGLTDKEISILDFLPTSDISADVKIEELKSSSTLALDVLEHQEIKEVPEEKPEPCAAALLIEANIPTPVSSVLSKWRTFISTAYYHPNLLAHTDVADLKELFQLLGTDISFKSVNVMIDLGKTVKDYKPVPYLQPMPPSNRKPPIFNFAHVKDFYIDMEMKVCIVKKYEINDSMKKAVTEMTNFIVEYPEALYLEVYGFILDFLLKFGVQSNVIIDAVMRTQTRRRKCQRPASVLILKKANKLGKGRKEFLQQRLLLESPEQKYHPVVPIISEPTPVRNLRNRRTGCTETDISPSITNDLAPTTTTTSCSKYINSQPLTRNGGDNCNTAASNAHSGLVFAVKRKLFVDECQEVVKIANEEATSLPATPITTDRLSIPVTQRIVGSRKKRFYSRRDSSTIEKPFTCSICPERSFAYKGNLVLHMKKKHSVTSGKCRPKRHENEVPAFSCPICLQGYASKYRCKAHIDRHHPDHVDWPPISNEDCLPKLKKTASAKCKRKYIGNKPSNGVIRKNTRHLFAPLSETQNSSPEEQQKTSRLCFNSKPDYYLNRFTTPQQQLNIYNISNGVSDTLKKLPCSHLNHVRTRQQFRALIQQN